MVRLVFIGGGHGQSTILSGFKNFQGDITAIVTVFDSGGSSGLLRKIYRFYPPGDIRRCLVALARNPIMAGLFEHRFDKYIFEHALGNLILLALTEKNNGDFVKALEIAQELLDANGKVLPVSLDRSELMAEFEDGAAILGEHEITQHGEESKIKIKKVWLVPEAKIYEGAANAIEESDAIIIGPGSLYTSIIPNFLVKGMREVLKRSNATKIYLANITTQKGETDNYHLSDHYKVLRHYIGMDVDMVIANDNFIRNEKTEEMYKKGWIYVPIDEENIDSLNGTKLITADLVDENKPWRHSPDKTRALLEKIIRNSK